MRQATRAMKEKQSRLSVLMTRKQELRNRVRGDSRKTREQVAKLAAEANDLRDLIARLEAARPTPPPEMPQGVGSDALQTAALPPPGARMGAQETAAALPPAATQHPSGLEPTRPFAAARGSLTFPARGQLVQRFGQAVGGGQSSRGIAMKARGGAQVVAPYDGEVVFAGPFRGYGQLLIIAHGDGYHILLAGLSRIDSIVGQWVLAGEPVGVLGPSEDGSVRLYVELRYNGDPINPLPWMAAREEKVSG
jgi:septal ring factor EnvC (AmiA/AmiB activator)